MARLRTAAAIVTMVAGTLAVTSQGAARAGPADGARAVAVPSAAVPTASARAPATTRVDLHITGCRTCTVTLQHAVRGGGPVWTSGSKKIGADHQVGFRVRRNRTPGMSFVLRAPWKADPQAVPNMVTRYRGHAVDTAVTRTAARHGRRAEGCWAGTRLDAVTLDFHVARVTGQTADGAPTPVPLVYATHTVSSWGPMVRTFKGTIANQDAFYCVRPPSTTVTFRAPGCAGCRLQLLNGAQRPENIWISPSRQVEGGTVAFRVPTTLTRGVSVVVRAPWEGSPPFTTVVVWRYGGHQVGDPVTFADARTRSRASGCWGGTTGSEVTVALTIRKVTVQGTTGPTAGSIAFADVTRPWLDPMFAIQDGVLGTQDVIVCAK